MQHLFDDLTGSGWMLTSRGAPDYFAWKRTKDGNLYFIAVEAVRKSGYRLRKHQKAVIECLARYGVPCYRFNCDTGEFQEINFRSPRAGISEAL